MTDLANDRQGSRWSRRPSRALAVLGGTALVVGGFVVWRALPAAPDAELDGLRVLTSTDRSSEGSDARLVGKLVAAGSCVGVSSDASTSLVVWPRGTVVEDDAVVTPGGIRAGLGERFDAGGGHEDYSGRLADLLDPVIPEDCLDASSGVFVLHGDS